MIQEKPRGNAARRPTMTNLKSIFLGTVLLSFLSALSYAQAPVPFISQPLVPDATAPGGPQFILTVNGTGFVANSVVNWNESALATQFVNGSQLTATVPAADIATKGTAWVTVVNPAPGGGTSNVTFFEVTAHRGDFLTFTVASFPVDASPLFLAVGDFNGDGKLDLAVPSLYKSGHNVSILLGNGKGNFHRASHPAAGIRPAGVAVGDFNGDSKLDLAVANDGSSNVSILLGDGTGRFTLASSPGAGAGPFSVAVGDFNGDGKLDLAVANEYSSTVSILLGDGTGNFPLASSLEVGGGPGSVAVGDFNGDDKLDLAVATTDPGTVSILLGDGTGNFTLASSPAVAYPTSVAVGDFNGDGKLDVAAGHGSGVNIMLQLGPAITLSPTSLMFGTQLVGTSSTPQPVTLTNVGGDPLKITKIAASANFSQTNNCPTKLPPGGQCTINVSFAPSHRGTLSGALKITDNAPKSPQSVPLAGVGTAVTLLPPSLDFGNQPVGTTSEPQVATLTNYGKQAVTIQRIHIAGKNSAAFAQTNTCGTSVPPGGNCTISVTFSPKHKGSKTAALNVFDNGGGSPQTVALSGTGT
jgi:FG-GAP-like repeat/Abnormal spindle-like microcephaly-assoc'd, ASPM-SPD-2-Hydin/FG-GAP repeat